MKITAQRFWKRQIVEFDACKRAAQKLFFGQILKPIPMQKGRVYNLFKSTEESRRLRRTVLYLYIILALLALLVAATYTWFSLSQTPRVSDMRLYISSETGLELAESYNSEEWGQTISFLDLVSDSSPLRPVTWSDARQSFIAVSYGYDGRMQETPDVLTDERNATGGTDCYYVLSTFYARTRTDCKVSLAEAVEINEGEAGAGTYVIGTPVWDADRVLHNDMGSGAECAVRLGFKVTPINGSTGTPNGESVFFAYEPNCDSHISGAGGYFPTGSIDGTDTLVGAERLILQSMSSWTEAYPVQRDVTIKQFGEFLSNPTLFSLKAGEKVRIDLYIWLEGQDSDCTNTIEEAMIMANIQFHTDYEHESGLVPIPKE